MGQDATSCPRLHVAIRAARWHCNQANQHVCKQQHGKREVAPVCILYVFHRDLIDEKQLLRNDVQSHDVADRDCLLLAKRSLEIHVFENCSFAIGLLEMSAVEKPHV
jgi:hypothetical protein